MARLRESLERRIYTRCKCGCKAINVRDRWAARERAREALLIVIADCSRTVVGAGHRGRSSQHTPASLGQMMPGHVLGKMGHDLEGYVELHWVTSVLCELCL